MLALWSPKANKTKKPPGLPGGFFVRGMFVTKFYGYKEASAEFSKARKKTTYDPLNKKEYLLHKLNAIRD